MKPCLGLFDEELTIDGSNSNFFSPKSFLASFDSYKLLLSLNSSKQTKKRKMAVENDGVVVKIEKVHTFAQTHGCFRWSEILRKTTSPVGRPTGIDWIC